MKTRRDAGDIDELLRDAGEQWRSQQRPPAEPAWHQLADRRPWQQIIALAALLASVAVIGAYGLGVLGTNQASRSPSPAPTPTLSGLSATPTTRVSPSASLSASPSVNPSPSTTAGLSTLIVRDRDEVTATGFICETDAGDVFVHPPFQSWDRTQFECGGFPLTAVDVSTLPGWSNTEHQSSYLTLRGVWTNGTVEVTAVDPASGSGSSSIYDLTDVTCDPPPGGWLEDGAIVDGVDVEAASLRLQAVIDGHPELYSGSWTGTIPATATTPAKHAYALGTVGDVTAAYAELKPKYPYNLCITAAEFSASALAPVETRLNERMHGGSVVWVANTAPWIDRVWLTLPVLDQAAADFIGVDADKIALEPFIRKLDATNGPATSPTP